MERLRILGEMPVRHFQDGKQLVDPDGNPDTSFLARIPADTAFTFQTLDARGLVLNMAQTWHQLRPGEIRHDCGGCHAHSQKPTEFSLSAAAKPDYAVWDLVNTTPLLRAGADASVLGSRTRESSDRSLTTSSSDQEIQKSTALPPNSSFLKSGSPTSASKSAWLARIASVTRSLA